MLPTHKTILPKKFAPKHTMSQGNAPHPLKGKLIYPHTINILHLSFHHSLHFLSSLQHAHTSLKSSKSNTYKTKRPLYSQVLYKGLFLRYLLYFILSIALSFCLWEDEGRCLGINFLLKLNRSRRLTGQIIEYSIDSFDLIDNPGHYRL